MNLDCDLLKLLKAKNIEHEKSSLPLSVSGGRPLPLFSSPLFSYPLTLSYFLPALCSLCLSLLPLLLYLSSPNSALLPPIKLYGKFLKRKEKSSLNNWREIPCSGCEKCLISYNLCSYSRKFSIKIAVQFSNINYCSKM